MAPAEKAAALRKKRMYLKQRAEEARADGDAGGGAPILAPEPALAPSFDPDVTGHRYRVLEDPSGVIARPVVAESGLDHEDGIDSVQVERSTVVRPRGQYLGGVPLLAWAQVQKDKGQFAFQGECGRRRWCCCLLRLGKRSSLVFGAALEAALELPTSA